MQSPVVFVERDDPRVRADIAVRGRKINGDLEHDVKRLGNIVDGERWLLDGGKVKRRVVPVLAL